MTRIDLRIDLELTRIDLRIDLPHALILSESQNTVSVIISCKTTKNVCVENTALSQMRSGSPRAACCGDPWGYLRTLRVPKPRVYTLSTLHHFDNKVRGTAKTGPLIPCERRPEKVEISENQEVTFETHFEI